MHVSFRKPSTGAVVVGFVIAALALVTVADGRGGAGARGNAVVFELKAKNGSRISGTARLAAAGRHVRVVLRLSGRVRNGSPAHIHTGPCSREPTFANPRIASGLNSIVNGRSVTIVLRTTLRTLRSRRLSINVHDPNSLGVVACGDIPRSS